VRETQTLAATSGSAGLHAPAHGVLNLGCGWQKYAEVRVDRYRGSANVIADVETNLPFASEVFECVYSRFLFEHLRNPGFVLGEMFRVLKPGGTLLLITDNAAYPPFHMTPRLGSGFHTGGYTGSGSGDKHYCLFTKEHLENHLNHVGLERVCAKYVTASDVGGTSGPAQRILRLCGISTIDILKPFSMANILATGTKPLRESQQKEANR
jgi:SAM-dependent methyltransferase